MSRLKPSGLCLPLCGFRRNAFGYEKMIIEKCEPDPLHLVNERDDPDPVPLIEIEFPTPILQRPEQEFGGAIFHKVSTCGMPQETEPLQFLRIDGDRGKILQQVRDITEMLFPYLHGFPILVEQGKKGYFF